MSSKLAHGAESRIAPIEAKIERAKEHVGNLEVSINAFKSEPFIRNYNRYSKPPRSIEQESTRWAVIVGEVVHQLRSALDHLACQLVEANGGTVTKQTRFPILESAKDSEARIEGLLKGASIKAIRFIKALKPYNGGNQHLFALHRLNLADKHRLLITVGAVRESVSDPASTQAIRYKDKGIRLVPQRADGTFEVEFADTDTFPLEDDAEIFRRIYKAELYPNANLTFEIVFGEKGVFDREPLVPSLLNLTNIIEGIIETIFNALPELRT
jgi:hypothetical protein